MRHKKLFANLLFAAVILLAAGALFLLRGAGKDRDAPLQARLIYGDGNASLDLPLDADGVYDVDTGYLTVHVEIRDGAARFIDSPCPDHVCEQFGQLSEVYDWAACIPAQAMLTIEPVE